MGDTPFHEFGCGHLIPIIEWRALRVIPFCTLCERPQHPTKVEVQPLPPLPGMKAAD